MALEGKLPVALEGNSGSQNLLTGLSREANENFLIPKILVSPLTSYVILNKVQLYPGLRELVKMYTKSQAQNK